MKPQSRERKKPEILQIWVPGDKHAPMSVRSKKTLEMKEQTKRLGIVSCLKYKKILNFIFLFYIFSLSKIQIS